MHEHGLYMCAVLYHQQPALSSMGFRQFSWTEDSKYIMYLQDVGGDENFHLYLQPLDGKPAKDLTAFDGVRAQNLVTDKHFPGEVLSPIDLP